MKESQLAPISSGLISINRPIYLISKRLLDILMCLLAMTFVAPLMALIALCIKLDSNGPVLFKQARVGQNGRIFTLYKFRTMCHNADPDLHRRYVELLISNQLPTTEAGADAPTFKLHRDPRVTRVGRILRRTSLDELPQIFNVLIGNMSLVGPRPPITYEVEAYQEWHKGRLAAIPGITGLWQVQGRSRVSFDDMVVMDLEYIQRQSLWLDIKILLLTIPAVISGNGAE